MPKNSSRADRVGDLLQRELSKIIASELSYSDTGMITISGVSVSDDLSYAKVYVTVLQDDKRDHAMSVLHNNENHFRGLLSKTIKLRITPKIKFVYDESINVGNRMEQLLESIKDKNEK